MEPLLCFPDPLPSVIAGALERAGYPWRAVGGPDQAAGHEPEDGWAGAVI